jgi:hypothetical protein
LTDDAIAKAGADPGSATGAAAKIMKDEAEAKQRRAAVRYLGTVDCHYWGEVAEPALIKALRADKNECVRFEAALALGNGCCCTKETIVSLTISVYGVDTIRVTDKKVKVRETRAGEFADNAPSETSERVKAAAYAALINCLTCYNEPVSAGPEPTKPGPEPTKPRPEPESTKPVAGTLPLGLTGMETEYQMMGQEKTLAQVVAEARRISTNYSPATASISLPTGSHSISEIIAQAVKPAQGAETASVMPTASMPANGHIQQTSMPVIATTNSREPLPMNSQPRYGGLIPWLSR